MYICRYMMYTSMSFMSMIYSICTYSIHVSIKAYQHIKALSQNFQAQNCGIASLPENLLPSCWGKRGGSIGCTAWGSRC